MGNPGAHEKPCETCAAYGIRTMTTRVGAWALTDDMTRVPCEPYPECRHCGSVLQRYPVARATGKED